MNSQNKIRHEHVFVGGMNTSTTPEFVENTQYEYMFNCDVLTTGDGNVGKVKTPKGNTLVEVELPIGTNITIGARSDTERNNMYYAVWNSEGYHTWFRYNIISNNVTKIIQDLTDTGDIQIFNWAEGELILHIDIAENNLLYWTIKGDIARKINISKCLDKTSSGYGTMIKEEFTRSYKKTSIYAPTASYFTDRTKPFNRLYGYQFRFAQGFIYDDNEKSHISDFSNTPNPDKEPFTGLKTIPEENNCIDVDLETGDVNVDKIEVYMQKTNPDGGFMDWVIIANLDKKELGISSNSKYTLKFYNDGLYISVDQSWVNLPFSYLPHKPETQGKSKNAMIYGVFNSGFEDVDINASLSLDYSPLFMDSGTIDLVNNPAFNITEGGREHVKNRISGEYVTQYNGNSYKSYNAKYTRYTILIGSDVKKGNIFKIRIYHAYGEDYNYTLVANQQDDAKSIANKIAMWLISTQRIFRKTPGLPDSDIFSQTTDGSGNVIFSFIFSPDAVAFPNAATSVQATNFSVLKDTGQSLLNMKMGSSRQLGFRYEDWEGGRKSDVYTSDNLIFRVDAINTHKMLMSTKISLTVNHTPPDWASYLQVMVTDDLVYDNFIQLYIQKVIGVKETTEDEYLDLIVGSLFTYQKIHPNSTLKYEFKRGDRIRLIKEIDTDNNVETFYDFFETEIISYESTTTTTHNEKVIVNGTTEITVEVGSSDNVGNFIVVGDIEREIMAYSSGKYTVDRIAPGGGTAGTDAINYPSYKIVNKRGVIRIKKPATVEIKSSSLIEVYTPAKTGIDSQTVFYEFGYKFPIIADRTENRRHFGDIQQQTDTQPAIILIDTGFSFARNRELPTNNSIENTQVYISQIEDPAFSDFYESRMVNLGRSGIKDLGRGIVFFDSRFYHSMNYIENTSINGLNIFYPLSYKDYNDKYGKVQLIDIQNNRMFLYKELKTAWVPIAQAIISQADGVPLIASSSQYLGDIIYFSEEGGVGNNPESVVVNSTRRYHVSPMLGAVIRISADGETPISEIYYIDNKMKEYIAKATANGSKIFGSFDVNKGYLLIHFEPSVDYIYNNIFDNANWKALGDYPDDTTVFTLVSGPSNGTIDFTDNQTPIYTPNAGYIGSDKFSFSAIINGEEKTKNVCLKINEKPQMLIWRAKQSSGYCVKDVDDNNTGYFRYSLLEQYDVISALITGLEKPNIPTDDNYVPDEYNTSSCPVPELNVFGNITNGTTTGVYYKVNSDSGEKGLIKITSDQGVAIGLSAITIPSMIGINKNIQLDRNPQLPPYDTPYGAIIAMVGDNNVDVKWSNRSYPNNSFSVIDGMLYEFLCLSFSLNGSSKCIPFNLSQSIRYTIDNSYISYPLTWQGFDYYSSIIKNEMSYPIRLAFIWIEFNDPNMNTDNYDNIQVKTVDFTSNESKIVSPNNVIFGDFAFFVISSDKLIPEIVNPMVKVIAKNSNIGVLGINMFYELEDNFDGGGLVSRYFPDYPSSNENDVQTRSPSGYMTLTIYNSTPSNNVTIRVTTNEGYYSQKNISASGGEASWPDIPKHSQLNIEIL